MNTSNVFVISDLHFGHKNIIEYCKRPFSSVEEMNKTLVDNWNSVVSDNDLVIFCGDFSWYKDKKRNLEYFNLLAGAKVLIKGNHDHAPVYSMPWLNVHSRYEFRHYDKAYVFDHYPIEEWNNKFHGSIHIHGHIHDNIECMKVNPIKNRHNACVEVIDYTPKKLEDFMNKGEKI